MEIKEEKGYTDGEGHFGEKDPKGMRSSDLMKCFILVA